MACLASICHLRPTRMTNGSNGPIPKPHGNSHSYATYSKPASSLSWFQNRRYRINPAMTKRRTFSKVHSFGICLKTTLNNTWNPSGRQCIPCWLRIPRWTTGFAVKISFQDHLSIQCSTSALMRAKERITEARRTGPSCRMGKLLPSNASGSIAAI